MERRIVEIRTKDYDFVSLNLSSRNDEELTVLDLGLTEGDDVTLIRVFSCT